MLGWIFGDIGRKRKALLAFLQIGDMCREGACRSRWIPSADARWTGWSRTEESGTEASMLVAHGWIKAGVVAEEVGETGSWVARG